MGLSCLLAVSRLRSPSPVASLPLRKRCSLREAPSRCFRVAGTHAAAAAAVSVTVSSVTSLQLPLPRQHFPLQPGGQVDGPSWSWSPACISTDRQMPGSSWFLGWPSGPYVGAGCRLPHSPPIHCPDELRESREGKLWAEESCRAEFALVLE